jgi:hypothetical protein
MVCLPAEVVTAKSSDPASEQEEDDNSDQKSDKLEGDEEVDYNDDEESYEGGGDGNFMDDNDWEELYACPLTVRFTQEKIHPFFYRRGPIVNVVPKIRPVMHARGVHDDVLELVPPFSPIHCLRKGTELWSLDNRRLYALQLAAMEQWPQRCRVRLLARDRLPRHKFKTQYRKLNTTTAGCSIDVCARYQQFDVWNWFDKAVEYEWYALSSWLGNILSAFEVIPVIGALLFRTGLTGFGTRVPLIAGFILAFAIDFLRQRVPYMERKICELHVRAVLDGDVRYLWPCRRRSDQASLAGVDAPSSAVQLAAAMALLLMLLLPYILGIPRDALRSSILSCWLGVACVLTVQLGSALREDGRPNGSLGHNGSVQHLLSPKHRTMSNGDRHNSLPSVGDAG